MSTTVIGDLGSATVIVMDKSTGIVMAITRFPQVGDAPLALSFIFFSSCSQFHKHASEKSAERNPHGS